MSDADQPQSAPPAVDNRRWAASREAARRGVKLFSSTSGAERVRRPTDAVLLGLGGLIILLTAIASDSSTGVEASATLFVDSLPGALDSLWRMAADFPLVWSLALIVIAIVADGRNGLVRDQILAGVLAGLGSMACYWVVEDSWPSVEAILGTDPPASFPAGRLAVAVGVIVTSSPHLSRPLRSLGRWVLFFGAFGTVFMHVATPGGTIAAVVVGSMAAACIHLVFGSPGGRPSLNDVATSVLELGVHAADLRAGRAAAGRRLDGARHRRRGRAPRDQGLRARRVGHAVRHPAVAVPLVPPLLDRGPPVPGSPGRARGSDAAPGEGRLDHRAEGPGRRSVPVGRRPDRRPTRRRDRHARPGRRPVERAADCPRCRPLALLDRGR